MGVFESKNTINKTGGRRGQARSAAKSDATGKDRPAKAAKKKKLPRPRKAERTGQEKTRAATPTRERQVKPRENDRRGAVQTRATRASTTVDGKPRTPRGHSGQPPVKAPSRAPVAKAAPKAAGRSTRKAKEPPAGNRRRGLRAISPRFVIIVMLLIIFVALAAGPVARNIEATSRLRAQEKELALEQKTTKALEKEVEEARSMAYIEEEARRQRLVAPNEILYLVTTDAAEPEVEYRLKSMQSMDEAWERIRQALHCGASRRVQEH